MINPGITTFTVETDHKFTDDEWAAIWTTAERNGLGASRSQGFGTFTRHRMGTHQALRTIAAPGTTPKATRRCD